MLKQNAELMGLCGVFRKNVQLHVLRFRVAQTVLSCCVQGHGENRPRGGRWLLQARAFSGLLAD